VSEKVFKRKCVKGTVPYIKMYLPETGAIEQALVKGTVVGIEKG
jgi:hypothetical protein